jgi:hypothetical protein
MSACLLLAGLAAGCSVVQPHPDVTDTLRAIRVTGGTRIDNPSRLVLPQFATVSVVHADGRVDHERLHAAQTGLAPYFSVTPQDAPWLLRVHWPDGAYPAEEGTVDSPPGSDIESTTSQSFADKAAREGMKGLRNAGRYLVHVGDRDVLIVDVVQTVNQTLVTRLEVKIEPWLRGRDWHDPLALTQAFMAVGAALSGS